MDLTDGFQGLMVRIYSKDGFQDGIEGLILSIDYTDYKDGMDGIRRPRRCLACRSKANRPYRQTYIYATIHTYIHTYIHAYMQIMVSFLLCCWPSYSCYALKVGLSACLLMLFVLFMLSVLLVSCVSYVLFLQSPPRSWTWQMLTEVCCVVRFLFVALVLQRETLIHSEFAFGSGKRTQTFSNIYIYIYIYICT